jgi:ribosomal protein S6--L-glutamate ligase
MILSFHPIIEADRNILCAGRRPNADDLAAIQAADAVVLPQGCPEALYRMARMNCPHIFPNLDARFDYPGKMGQIRLFRKLGLAHPATQCFGSVAHFHRNRLRIGFPAVIKLDWGGQGETVFKVGDTPELAKALERVTAFENSGQPGFLIQQFIPTRNRSLRVALIHTQTIVYWRIQAEAHHFGTSVALGARIDHDVDPKVKTAAQTVVQNFCQNTGLQLGGFDFIFDDPALNEGRIEPLILEINYFFGRSGLGGSEAYYRLLEAEFNKWLSALTLKPLNN